MILLRDNDLLWGRRAPEVWEAANLDRSFGLRSFVAAELSQETGQL